MAKITLASILTAFASALSLNNRFSDIEEHLNDKVLYRDNPTGEPNQMENDLDMNNNRVMNLPSPVADQEPARWVDIKNGVAGVSEPVPSPIGNEDKAISSSGTGLVYKRTTFQKATLAALLADTTITLGQIWGVEDYALGNNSGLLLFKVVAASTGTPDGGSFLDHDTLSLQLKQLFPGYTCFKMFGATGAGTGSAGADQVPVQNCLNYTESNGLPIYPRAGEYLVTSLTYKPGSGQKPLTLKGRGVLRAGEPENNLANSRTRGVILHFSDISGSTGAFGIGDGVNNPQGVNVENIYLLGKTSQNVASPTDTTVGLKLDNAPEAVMRNVHCSKFHTAWEMEDSHSGSFYNCSGVRSYIPIRGTLGFNAVKFYSWKSHTCYWAGEITASSAGVAFYSPWFETLTKGFLINNGSSVVNGLAFHNPHCELIGGHCFELGFDRAGSETTGNIQSVHIFGGYYDSVGTDVSSAKMDISAATSRDVVIYGEMGSFDVSQIDGNFAPVKIIRSEQIEQTHAGGPYKQEFFGYKSGIPDTTVSDLLTLTVPTGDCIYQVEVSASGATALGSFTAMTQGVITIGRKSGSGDCYATYSETVSKVAADSGAGQSYTGVFVLSIAVATNVVTLKLSADNNQSQSNQVMTKLTSYGGERSQGSLRKLAFANA